MLGHIGQLFHFSDLVHAQRTAGQFVDPGQAAQVHLACKLIERGGGQVVRLIKDQQAVIQIRKQLGAERGKQQIMIGHNDLRGHQVLAALVINAVAESRAVLARARR